MTPLSLYWRILSIVEPGGSRQPSGSQRVGHTERDLVTYNSENARLLLRNFEFLKEFSLCFGIILICENSMLTFEIEA